MSMSYKRLIPCIFIKNGAAVTWFDNTTILMKNPVELAKKYSRQGADEILIFDLSENQEEHDLALKLMERIHLWIKIPMVVGGNIRCLGDVKRIIQAGAKRAILNFSKQDAAQFMEEAANQLGKEKIGVSLKDFDTLFKQQQLIENCCSELIFLHRLDLDSVMNITEIPSVVLTDTMDESELIRILKAPGIKGISGKFVNDVDMDFTALKKRYESFGIPMTTFESFMEFSEFHVGKDGLIPVITQEASTKEVLTLGYMNQDAFEKTLKTGKMTYYSRSRKALWVKGEDSGNFQYLKNLTLDCDGDALLAKVEQIGDACETGNYSCFFRRLAGEPVGETNPLQIFEQLYHQIADRREKNPLLENGTDYLLSTIGKQVIDLLISSKNLSQEDVKDNFVELIYGLTSLMVERDITWEHITAELLSKIVPEES